MICKPLSFILVALVVSEIQGEVYPAEVIEEPAVVTRVEPYDPHPQYSFAYEVQDPLTGDFKTQSETRDGDVVQGSYSFIEADGTRRLVEYTADPINGFNAVVNREPAFAVAPVESEPVAVATAAPVPVVSVSRALAAPSVASRPLTRTVAAPYITRTVAVAPANNQVRFTKVVSTHPPVRTVAAAPVVARQVVTKVAPAPAPAGFQAYGPPKVSVARVGRVNYAYRF